MSFGRGSRIQSENRWTMRKCIKVKVVAPPPPSTIAKSTVSVPLGMYKILVIVVDSLQNLPRLETICFFCLSGFRFHRRLKAS